MIPKEHIFIYKREWKKNKFLKKDLRWYRKYEEVTLCFSIKNFKSNDWYVPLIGILRTKEMKSPYPLIYDDAYICCGRLMPIDFEMAQETDGFIKVNPEKTVALAMKHFEHMTTMDNAVSYILNNELFDMTLEKIEKRIYR